MAEKKLCQMTLTLPQGLDDRVGHIAGALMLTPAATLRLAIIQGCGILEDNLSVAGDDEVVFTDTIDALNGYAGQDLVRRSVQLPADVIENLTTIAARLDEVSGWSPWMLLAGSRKLAKSGIALLAAQGGLDKVEENFGL